MEKRIEKYWNNLEADKITFAEFLKSLKKDLGVVSIVFDTKLDLLVATYGDIDEEVIMSEGLWPHIKDNEAIDLATVVVKLKKDFASLLNDKKYHGELGEFLNRYKLTKVDFNLQNDEVKFSSGISHLTEGIDYDNQ